MTDVQTQLSATASSPLRAATATTTPSQPPSLSVAQDEKPASSSSTRPHPHPQHHPHPLPRPVPSDFSTSFTNADSFLAHAQSLGLTLSREEYERARSGVIAFLRSSTDSSSGGGGSDLPSTLGSSTKLAVAGALRRPTEVDWQWEPNAYELGDGFYGGGRGDRSDEKGGKGKGKTRRLPCDSGGSFGTPPSSISPVTPSMSDGRFQASGSEATMSSSGGRPFSGSGSGSSSSMGPLRFFSSGSIAVTPGGIDAGVRGSRPSLDDVGWREEKRRAQQRRERLKRRSVMAALGAMKAGAGVGACTGSAGRGGAGGRWKEGSVDAPSSPPTDNALLPPPISPTTEMDPSLHLLNASAWVAPNGALGLYPSPEEALAAAAGGTVMQSLPSAAGSRSTTTTAAAAAAAAASEEDKSMAREMEQLALAYAREGDAVAAYLAAFAQGAREGFPTAATSVEGATQGHAHVFYGNSGGVVPYPTFPVSHPSTHRPIAAEALLNSITFSKAQAQVLAHHSGSPASASFMERFLDAADDVRAIQKVVKKAARSRRDPHPRAAERAGPSDKGCHCSVRGSMPAHPGEQQGAHKHEVFPPTPPTSRALADEGSKTSRVRWAASLVAGNEPSLTQTTEEVTDEEDEMDRTLLENSSPLHNQQMSVQNQKQMQTSRRQSASLTRTPALPAKRGLLFGSPASAHAQAQAQAVRAAQSLLRMSVSPDKTNSNPESPRQRVASPRVAFLAGDLNRAVNGNGSPRSLTATRNSPRSLLIRSHSSSTLERQGGTAAKAHASLYDTISPAAVFGLLDQDVGGVKMARHGSDSAAGSSRKPGPGPGRVADSFGFGLQAAAEIQDVRPGSAGLSGVAAVDGEEEDEEEGHSTSEDGSDARDTDGLPFASQRTMSMGRGRGRASSNTSPPSSSPDISPKSLGNSSTDGRLRLAAGVTWRDCDGSSPMARSLSGPVGREAMRNSNKAHGESPTNRLSRPGKKRTFTRPPSSFSEGGDDNDDGDGVTEGGVPTAEELLKNPRWRKIDTSEIDAALKRSEITIRPPDRYYLLPPGPRTNEKPAASYAGMIGHAILSASDKRLSLSEIYAYISEAWPFYKKGDKGWMNSIRHNLSLNKSFLKQPREKGIPGKGCFWVIAKGDEHKFVDGNIVKTRAPGPPGPPAPPPQHLPPPPSSSKPSDSSAALADRVVGVSSSAADEGSYTKSDAAPPPPSKKRKRVFSFIQDTSSPGKLVDTSSSSLGSLGQENWTPPGMGFGLSPNRLGQYAPFSTPGKFVDAFSTSSTGLGGFGQENWPPSGMGFGVSPSRLGQYSPFSPSRLGPYAAFSSAREERRRPLGLSSRQASTASQSSSTGAGGGNRAITTPHRPTFAQMGLDYSNTLQHELDYYTAESLAGPALDVDSSPVRFGYRPQW